MKSDLIDDMFSGKRKHAVKNIPVKKAAKPLAEKSTTEKIIEKENRKREDNPEGFFTKLCGVILRISIFMIFLGVPIFFTGFSFQGIAFEKQIYFYFWTLLALVAWASKGVLVESLKIKKTLLDVPIIIFWLIYLLATIFSIDRWHSLWGAFGDPSRGLLGVTAVIIFYYIFISNFSRKMFAWNLGAFFVSGFLVSLISAFKFFDWQLLSAAWLKVIPLSLLGSVASLGILFSAMLIFAIMLVMKLRASEQISAPFKNIITALLLAVIIGELALIWSIYFYVNWVGIFLGMGLFLVFIVSKYIKVPEGWAWLPMAVFVALLIVKLAGPLDVLSVDLPTEASPSYKVSWEVAKNALKDKMILGTGPATYGYDFSRYQPKDFNLSFPNNLRFYQGTGIIMEAIPSIGLLGAFALIIAILSFISIIFYLLKNSREKEKIYSLGFLSVSIVTLVGFLGSRTDGPAILFGSLAIILTLVVLFQESESEDSFYALTLKASAKFALTMAFIFMLISAGVVFLFIFIGWAYAADIHAFLATKQLKSGQPEKTIQEMKKTLSAFNKEGSYFTLAGQEYMLLANNENNKKEERNTNIIVEYMNKALENSKLGSNLMPSDVQTTEALAQVYENLGLYGADTFKLAEDNYKKALELEPHNPSFYVKLGQIKLNEAVKSNAGGDKSGPSEATKNLVQEAKDLFQKSIDEKNNFSAGFYNLAIAEETLGNVDAAIEDMGKAVLYERNNLTYNFNLGRLHQSRGWAEDNQKAEAIFKGILAVNSNEINTHFNLGLLYDKMDRRDEAVVEYKKVLNLLPTDSWELRAKVEGYIDNKNNIEAESAVQPELEPIVETENSGADLNARDIPPENIRE